MLPLQMGNVSHSHKPHKHLIGEKPHRALSLRERGIRANLQLFPFFA